MSLIDEYLERDDTWHLVENRLQRKSLRRFESLFTLANGYMGLRGIHDQPLNDSYPGLYIAGLYDKTLFNNKELVNLPNPVPVLIGLNKDLMSLERTLSDYFRVLNMRRAILLFKASWKLRAGARLTYESIRLVHAIRKHLVMMVGCINAQDMDEINLMNVLDANVHNSPFDEVTKVYHLRILKKRALDDGGMYMEVATRFTKLKAGIASRIIADPSDHMGVFDQGRSITEVLKIRGGKSLFRKYVTIYTSREVDDLEDAALSELENAARREWTYLLNEHVKHWRELWNTSDIVVEGDRQAQHLIRFNIFQLLQVMDSQYGIPARGFHGEGYRGHVFWEMEIYMLPFYTLLYPDAAKRMLLYRYRMLEDARRNARRNGFKGAQYPWEATDDGEEMTPSEIMDLITGETVRIWTGEEQHHITADVAYAFDYYYRATGDDEFMTKYGLEVIFETARFWASRVKYKTGKGYVIERVMGPDEIHEHINNSAYVNFMARWNLLRAYEYYYMARTKWPKQLKRIIERIGLSEDEVENWRRIGEEIYLPWDRKTGFIEEFDGYTKLEDMLAKEVDVKAIDLERLKKTRLIKQADIILLLHILGDQFDFKTKKVNYEYYEPRTLHLSSLSPVPYAIIASEIGKMDDAYRYFMMAAKMDLEDIRGDLDKGIHIGCIGGLWQVVVNGFAGIKLGRDKLIINPKLPPHWRRLELGIKYRGTFVKRKYEQHENASQVDK